MKKFKVGDIVEWALDHTDPRIKRGVGFTIVGFNPIGYPVINSPDDPSPENGWSPGVFRLSKVSYIKKFIDEAR